MKLFFITLSLLFLTFFAKGVNFYVLNNNNSGSGSLRQAIIDANLNPGPDSILFGIPGSAPHTITLSSNLPDIIEEVVIDGRTQLGYLFPSAMVCLEKSGTLYSFFNLNSRNIEITGMAFVKSSLNIKPNYAILSSSTTTDLSGLKLVENYFGEILSGFGLNQDLNCTDVIITANYFYNCSRVNQLGFWQSVSNIRISNNFFINDILDEGGIKLTAQKGIPQTIINMRNIFIENNKFNNVEEAIKLIVYAPMRFDSLFINNNIASKGYSFLDFSFEAPYNNAGIFKTITINNNIVDSIFRAIDLEVFPHNGGGIHIKDLTIKNNFLSGNTLYSTRGIYFSNFYQDGNGSLRNLVIDSNQISNFNYGIDLETGYADGKLIIEDFSIFENEVYNCSSSGIYLEMNSADSVNQIKYGLLSRNTIRNCHDGISIYSQAIWQTSLGLFNIKIEDNSIHNNDRYGITLENWDDIVLMNAITITHNSIYDNGDKGIRVKQLGQMYSNPLIPYPVLDSLIFKNGVYKVYGHLQSQHMRDYRLEFFSNSTPDTSGFGEGETFLFETIITTDTSGYISFVRNLPINLGNLYLTATVTDRSTRNTSAFSNNISILTTDVVELPEQDFKIYPNPAKHSIYLNHHWTQSATLSILDIQGRVVMEEKVDADIHEISFDLLPGAYLIKIDNQQKNIYTGKLMIE